MATIDRDKVRKDFGEAVNMTPAEIEKWLDTKDSRAVGWKGEDGDGKAKASGMPAAGRSLRQSARRSRT